ncbi:MAG: hypothetical protein J6Z41_09170, partial [Prevotella sp.]|nr:hypothetical protein [Prevotella sp.]
NDNFITETEYKDGAWSTFSAIWTDYFEDNDSITKEKVEANSKDWSSISKYKSGEYDYITADSYQQVVWEEAASLYSTPFVKTSDLTSSDLASYTSYDTNNDNVITEQEVLDKVWADATALTPYDTDNNGTVTRTEINDKAWADATDATNGSLKDYSAYTDDGKLTKSEVEDKTWNDLSSALSGYNNYSQGTITKESVANAHWRTISAYDYNSDGTITKAEAGEYAWNTMSNKDYALKVYDYDGDGTITKSTICDKISSFDTNSDGTITKSEVSTAARGWEAVGVFDYDNDGEIGENDAVTYINSLLSACSFSGMENSMRSYMKGIYFDGESDYKAIVGDNNRPWVTFYDSESSDNIVTRLPYYAWENQFSTPVSDPINYATAKDQSTAKYAGWNQFILAFADAQTDQPETHIERWTGSKWYTICVPFSLSQHQVQETFGTQTEVVEFTKVIKDENGVTTFYFYKPAAELDESGSGGENNNTNYIKPYHPYMIHPGLTTAQVGMGGEHSEYRVILGELNTSGAGSPKDSWSQAQKAEKAITVNFYDYYEADNYDNTETDGKTATRYTFYGMAEEGKAYKPNSVDPYSGYTEMSTIPVGSFFWAYTKSNGAETNDGSFYHNAGQAIAWPQYTAIIYLSKGTDYMDYNVGSNARNGGTIFDLEDAEYIYDYDVDTGVLKVSLPAQPKAADNRVYNLNGQYVGDSLDGLTKGIYIMNGKKYVVK